MYNDELKLGLEYQGQQHSQHVTHFDKTKEDFIKRQQYDQLKAKLCEEKGVTLLTVAYTVNNKDICKHIYKKLIDLGYNISEKNIDEFDINDIYKANPKTEEIKQILENKGYKLIDGKYLCQTSLITYECDKGHTRDVIAKYIIGGSGCEICARGKSEDTKIKTSNSMKALFKTPEGKEAKKLAHEKRTETMKIEKEELRATITHKICKYSK